MDVTSLPHMMGVMLLPHEAGVVLLPLRELTNLSLLF